MTNIFWLKSAKIACWSFLCAALVFSFGCNPSVAKKNEIRGKVTYKGAPVTGGTLSMYGGSGFNQMSTCTINADGTFVMNDAAPGPNKVVVDTESLKTESALPSNATPEQKKMMKEGQEMGQKLGGTKTGGTYVQIPAKYRDVKSTPLTYDVTEGKQTKDFDLPD